MDAQMRTRCPIPTSSNSHSSTQEILLRIHTNPMKKLEDFVFKLAQAHPNAPLAPPAEALLRDRLRRFVSDYRTPDHPPYSAMIQNALEELNEKWGSSEESISKYLEKRYDDLPWGHSALLKHHLEKTCESGDIVLTRAQKYQLAGSLKSSTRLKSKPRRRKWRWECERLKHNLRKSNLSKKRNQQRSKKVEGIKKRQGCDEKEKCLTENGVNVPCTIAKADIWAAPAQKHQEKEQSKDSQPELSTHERPPGFELVIVENLYQLGSSELELEPDQASAGEVIRSTQRNSEPGAVTELATPLKAGKYDSPQSENMETPPNKEILSMVPVTLKQMHQPQLTEVDAKEVAQSVTKDTKLIRDGKRGWRRKNKPKISEATGIITARDSQELSQQPPSREEVIFQGKQQCRIQRAPPAIAEVAKDANTMDILPTEITVCRRKSKPLKERPSNQPSPKRVKAASLDGLQDPPKIRKLRILLKKKSEADAENLKVVDDCREQEVKQSGKLAVYGKMEPKRMADVLLPGDSKQHLEEVPKKYHGRLPKRRSARVQNRKMKPAI